MRFVTISLAAVSFGLYAYAIQRLFSREPGIDWRMRWVQLGGTVAAVIHLQALWLSPVVIGWGSVTAVAMYVTALLVFGAAWQATRARALSLAFSTDTPRHLVHSGIYRRIRHPFYTAYSLTWLAGVVQAPQWSTALSAGVMMAMYVAAARQEETKFAASALANEYRAYRMRAGMFWPRG